MNHGSIPFRSTFDGLEAIFAEGSVSDSVRFDIQETSDAAIVSQKLATLDEHLTAASRVYGRVIRISESWINSLGYGFLARGDAQGAIRIFGANVSRFPESANVYDSLGDAYLAAGDHARAKEALKEAVRRAERTGDPMLTNAQSKLRQLEAAQPPPSDGSDPAIP